MHGWDILTPSNYDQHQGWGPYRTEPRDYSVNLKQIKTESSPTSPLSMESNEFSNHTMFFNEHHHMAQGMTPLGQMQQRPIAFNPLTPPGYPNPTMHAQPLLNTPQSAVPLQEQSTPATPFRSQYPVANNLTPSYTPPMDVTPPKSPKYTMDGDAMLQKDEMHELNSNSGEDTRSMDSDHDDLRTPKVNSHGKVKTFKCKQCSYVAVTKLSFWEHTESHIPLEKRLKCPKCPFVTEFKHHLEYHLHNHDGSKPFQCPQCIYSCVNKSMLNSHLKSHSNVKKYNCADCNYATKYCHSLKLHLRKNGHKPGTVFNMDGTIDPSPVIDVHGRRRGPKTKSSGSKRSPAKTAEDGQQPSRRRKLKSESQFNETEVMQPQDLSPATQQQQQQFQSMMPSMLQNPFANIFNNHQHHNFPLFPYLNFNIQMLAAQQQAAFGQLSPNMQHESQNMHSPVHSRDEDENSSDDDDDASFKGANQSVELKSISSTAAVTSNDQEKVDLSNNNEPHRINEKRELVEAVAVKPTIQQQQQPGTPSSGKNKRKGRAFKLDMMKEAECDDDDVEVSTNTSRQEQHPISKEAEAKRETPTSSQQSDPESSSQPQSSTATQQIFECKYCEIAFKDALLYTIHMGYHGYNDVFTCNSCGEKCSDRVSFFLHIARSSHN